MDTDNTPVRSRLAVVMVALMLSGCGSKPPGCADADTLNLARKLIVDKLAGEQGSPDPQALQLIRENDPDGLLKQFIAGLTIKINTITSDGFDANAKRNSCQGNLEISGADVSLTLPMQYSTQLVEGGGDQFVLRTSDIDSAINRLQSEAFTYWRIHRYLGQWTGSYACDGLEGNTSGPKGPFSMQVSADADKNLRLSLSRLTRGGGTESLKGDVDFTGAVRLSGGGANSPDDKWNVRFTGQINGNTLEAGGRIVPIDGAESRSCHLTLQRGAKEAQALPATSEAAKS